jgi:multiple antibiotic resistance protein
VSESGVVWQFALLAFSSLFSVINPIGAAPLFVAFAQGASPAQRRRMALRACLAAVAVLLAFAAAGGAIFSLFGITVPAFQIAGGLLFTVMAFRNVTAEEKQEAAGTVLQGDPSIVPLGIPIIAGPGAISTVMVLVGQARGLPTHLALAGAIFANIVLTAVLLLAAPAIVARIGENGQRIVSKIMGLITTVIGVQFIIRGVSTILTDIIRAAR